MQIIKNLLKKIGVEISLTKNLTYKDPFFILKNNIQNSNPVIFDIGSHGGGTVNHFNELFNNPKIYAFEPMPETYQVLKQNTQHLNNVNCFQLALSDEIGKADFHITTSNDSSSLFKPIKTNTFIDNHTIEKEMITVDTITLDEFIRIHEIKEIDLLKMDVQGAELKVLNGSVDCLSKKTIKYIFLEFWFLKGYDGQPLYHEIASYLEQFGYLPFALFNIHYRKDGHFLWGDALFYHQS